MPCVDLTLVLLLTSKAAPANLPIPPISGRLDDLKMKSSKPKEWTDGEREKFSVMIRRGVVASEIATAVCRPIDFLELSTAMHPASAARHTAPADKCAGPSQSTLVES